MVRKKTKIIITFYSYALHILRERDWKVDPRLVTP